MCDAQTVWGCPDWYGSDGKYEALYRPDLLIQRVCLRILCLNVVIGYYSPL